MAGEYEDVFVYAGAYSSADEARMDYDAIAEMHRQDWIGKYQAAIFEKTGDGKVKVLDTTSTTRTTGAKWGTAVGAVMGLVFPPSIVVGAAAGAGVGALAGNVAKGWFKGDIEQIGKALDTGEAGVLVVAEATPDIGAEKLLQRAAKDEKRQIDADAEAAKQELDQMVEV
jgi:uncharacterized membrane protein